MAAITLSLIFLIEILCLSFEGHYERVTAMVIIKGNFTTNLLGHVGSILLMSMRIRSFHKLYFAWRRRWILEG
jgi:hypothetical protein